jgi:hypothetical protein
MAILGAGGFQQLPSYIVALQGGLEKADRAPEAPEVRRREFGDLRELDHLAGELTRGVGSRLLVDLASDLDDVTRESSPGARALDTANMPEATGAGMLGQPRARTAASDGFLPGLPREAFARERARADHEVEVGPSRAVRLDGRDVGELSVPALDRFRQRSPAFTKLGEGLVSVAPGAPVESENGERDVLELEAE